MYTQPQMFSLNCERTNKGYLYITQTNNNELSLEILWEMLKTRWVKKDIIPNKH